MALYTNKMDVFDYTTSLAYNNSRCKNCRFLLSFVCCHSYYEGRNSLIELVFAVVGSDRGGCGTGSYHSCVL